MLLGIQEVNTKVLSQDQLQVVPWVERLGGDSLPLRGGPAPSPHLGR